MAKRERFDYAAQWADVEESQELTLPSGKKVLVRTPDVLLMARQGMIPDTLTPIVEKFIFEKEATIARVNATDKAPGERLKDYAEYMRYVDVIVVGACIEPVFRFTPKAGELALDRLGTADRIFIWSWAEGLGGELATFPDNPDDATADVPAVADGEESGAAA